MKTVADVMTPAPIVVEVPGSRNDAINTMVRNNLTGLPVVRSSDGKLMANRHSVNLSASAFESLAAVMS